jgi:alpha-tubulin suppressor-like RCC1 family protein
VLHPDGTIACWGNNSNGQLGNGTLVDMASPVNVVVSAGGPPFTGAMQISCGAENSTCALRLDGTAWCWGWNSHGQLGDGTVVDQTFPVQVMAGPGVPLTSIAEIFAGEQSACARKTDDTLWCWGLNNHGQLGNGTFTDSAVPVQVVDMVGASFLAAGGTVAALNACAWQASGALSCWGWNSNGEVGDGTMIDKPFPTATGIVPVTSVAAANIATCASVTNTTAYCWGGNTYGQLGDGTVNMSTTPVAVQGPTGGDLTGVVEVGSSDRGDCARLSDGSVWCWGDNSVGQLGTGSLVPAMTTLPVQVQLSATASALAIGNLHGCALLTGDVVECWGSNISGQLGRGSFTAAEPVPTAVQVCP